MTPWAPRTSPYVTLPSRNPTLIYQDVVVSLDAKRGVNNGSPSLLAQIWRRRCLNMIGHARPSKGADALLAELDRRKSARE
jgi:hypothetical protein